jgi:CRISPR/Cas system-associated endonuclease Cas1
VKSSLLFLPDNGTALQVRRGALRVRIGFGSTETFYPPRVHGFRTIILAGQGVSITGEAIRWTAREGVALYLMGMSGEAFAVIGEAASSDHRRSALAIRQRQFRTVLDPCKRFEVARKIVGAKLRTLALHPADAQAFRAEIAGAESILNLMTAEARAGGVYFSRFQGSELRFSNESASSARLATGIDDVPDHWRVFVARAAPAIKGLIGTSKARNAATPIGALLNYAYAVALGQCTRAVIGAGLDACHGFLHVPRQGRLSLSYDILELHRADLTSAVFAHATKTLFARSAFEQSRTGVVSLDPDVARDMAKLALSVATIAACSKSVRRVLRWL